jgi:hypothetical protein
MPSRRMTAKLAASTSDHSLSLTLPVAKARDLRAEDVVNYTTAKAGCLQLARQRPRVA